MLYLKFKLFLLIRGNMDNIGILFIKLPKNKFNK